MGFRAPWVLIFLAGGAVSIHTDPPRTSGRTGARGVVPEHTEVYGGWSWLTDMEVGGGALNLIAHAPLTKLSPEEKAWNGKVFFSCVGGVLALLALTFCGVGVWGCTSGRRYVFAGPCMDHMKAELAARTTAGVKDEAVGAAFRARCQALLAEHAAGRGGAVAWTKEFKAAMMEEYGEGLKNHELFKEIDAANEYEGSVKEQDFEELQKTLLFIKYDVAVKESEGNKDAREAV